MSLTIEHRISNLLVERLKQHLVNGVSISIDAGKSISLYDKFSISGTASIAYPRSFEIEIIEADVCRISEQTLFADLGTSAPPLYDQEILFAETVSFQLANTGLEVTIGLDSDVGDSWLVRLGTAYTTIQDIYSHPFDYEGLSCPSIAVYSAGNARDPKPLEKQESVMEVALFLTLSKEQVENGDHFEIIGDICNCINRDQHLWDGTTCLASDVVYKNDDYFEQTDRGNSIFVCRVQITYTNNLKDARLK